MIAALLCHCSTALSLRATTRNPVDAWHWIPDQVRDDKLPGLDDKLLDADDKWLAAKALACECQRNPETCHRIDQQHQNVPRRVLRPLVHEQGAHQIDRVGQRQPL